MSCFHNFAPDAPHQKTVLREFFGNPHFVCSFGSWSHDLSRGPSMVKIWFQHSGPVLQIRLLAFPNLFQPFIQDRNKHSTNYTAFTCLKWRRQIHVNLCLFANFEFYDDNKQNCWQTCEAFVPLGRWHAYMQEAKEVSPILVNNHW